MSLLNRIAVIPDFPKAGINFYDIQSLLKEPDVLDGIIDDLAAKSKAAGADIILGIESRGFLTGVPVAQKLGLPFGMVRKKGKLPGEVVGQEYTLEYGTDTVEIQKSLIKPGMKVVIMDDLLATGGTMKATCDLVRKVGGQITLAACIIELYELSGKEKLEVPFIGLVQAPLDPFSRDISTWNKNLA